MSDLHRLAGGAVATDAGSRQGPRPVEVAVMARDAILRSGLAAYLRGAAAITVVDGRPPVGGVVVLATDLIDSDAIAALRAVRLQGVTGMVVLASRLDAEQAARAAGAGACHWLGRWEATPRALADAVTAAAACTHLAEEHRRTWAAASCAAAPAGAGSRPVATTVVAATPETGAHTATAAPSDGAFPDHGLIADPSGSGLLCARDIDVLRRIAEGQSTAAIAEDLAYSESTIKNIVHQAVATLGARNRTHAVSIAIRSGVI
jgi:DNA-binding NarL/FixJ family response regulator